MHVDLDGQCVARQDTELAEDRVGLAGALRLAPDYAVEVAPDELDATVQAPLEVRKRGNAVGEGDRLACRRCREENEPHAFHTGADLTAF
jgi:hypothetical protein